MQTIKLLSIIVSTFILASCGSQPQKAPASLQNRHETPANHVTSSDVKDLLTHLRTIVSSATQTGSLSVSEFVKIMPMNPDQREIIVEGYPGSFAVTCQNGLCNASATGTATQAQMDVVIEGLPTNPALTLADNVETQFALSGDDAVEFCNIEGLAAKKFFFSLKIQGLFLELKNNQPHLNVNIGDDQDNYTCQGRR